MRGRFQARDSPALRLPLFIRSPDDDVSERDLPTARPTWGERATRREIGSPYCRRNIGGTGMHAVVVKVTINDPEAADSALREQVVPGVSQTPGFVAGYWTRKDNGGLSMLIFESEEAASGMSDRVSGMVPDTVTLEGVEVREVVAHA
jgi:hypothetical protein